jgi:DNA replication protein DnaC
MSAPRVKLDIDATRDKLAALGLGHAVETLESLLGEAVRAEMPAHVFLDRLLDAERSGREERRIRTMLKMSKIPTGQGVQVARRRRTSILRIRRQSSGRASRPSPPGHGSGTPR